MFELDITDFFNDDSPRDYSDSIANSGLDNIGAITWANALNSESDFIGKMSDGEKDEVRNHFCAYGAWDDSEVDSWADNELNALLIQDISGSINECMDSEGSLIEDNGRLYLGDDGKYYFLGGE